MIRRQSIEDNGHGISYELKTKIFEPLFTAKQSGTGLGLISCKNIIEQHGVIIEKSLLKIYSDELMPKIVRVLN